MAAACPGTRRSLRRFQCALPSSRHRNARPAWREPGRWRPRSPWAESDSRLGPSSPSRTACRFRAAQVAGSCVSLSGQDACLRVHSVEVLARVVIRAEPNEAQNCCHIAEAALGRVAEQANPQTSERKPFVTQPEPLSARWTRLYWSKSVGPASPGETRRSAIGFNREADSPPPHSIGVHDPSSWRRSSAVGMTKPNWARLRQKRADVPAAAHLPRRRWLQAASVIVLLAAKGVQASCPNLCSHKGDCVGNVCHCFQGHSGPDCSLSELGRSARRAHACRPLCYKAQRRLP